MLQALGRVLVVLAGQVVLALAVQAARLGQVPPQSGSLVE
jgi:hypothetical protein